MLCSKKENDTVRDELICILVHDWDIGIYASLLFLSFEDIKKYNSSNNNKLWVKISIKSMTQT